MIVCIDDRGGYLFNHRRVSSDKAVTEDILVLIENCQLWISPYSAGLFREITHNDICADELFLEKLGENDYCLIEKEVGLDFWMQAKEIIVYKWNRVYPYDTVFPYKEVTDGFSLLSVNELTGNSHEKITKEVYQR